MRYTSPVRISWAFGIVLVSMSCRPEQEPPGRRYELVGRVVSVDAGARRLTIAHEEIPEFMQAMTMPFDVKDDWVFQAVGPGDEVRATLVVTDESSWLEDILVSKKSSAADATAPLLAIPGEPNPGDTVPDFTLVNQDGKVIHLGQYRGQTLVLTFIYTRCPLPEYCPRMTSHFAELEEALQREPDRHEKTHLLTVSFDFEYDSPAILKEYAGTRIPGHSPSFEHWELATGTEEEIQAITEFFGLTYLPDQDQFVHSLRTAVIDPNGVLFKLYRGNEWEPEDILEDLKSMERGK